MRLGDVISATGCALVMDKKRCSFGLNAEKSHFLVMGNGNSSPERHSDANLSVLSIAINTGKASLNKKHRPFSERGN